MTLVTTPGPRLSSNNSLKPNPLRCSTQVCRYSIAIAVDALVACRAEGRLEIGLLASTIKALAATPLTKWSRYAKSIRRAVQVDGAINPVAFEMLCSIVVPPARLRPKTPPWFLTCCRRSRSAMGTRCRGNPLHAPVMEAGRPMPGAAEDHAGLSARVGQTGASL